MGVGSSRQAPLGYTKSILRLGTDFMIGGLNRLFADHGLKPLISMFTLFGFFALRVFLY